MKHFQPKILQAWTHPDHYSGETYFDYYRTGIGQSRDSDCLERANFIAMLEKLGGESKTVLRVRAGHWAVGWVESILIHKSDIIKLLLAAAAYAANAANAAANAVNAANAAAYAANDSTCVRIVEEEVNLLLMLECL